MKAYWRGRLEKLARPFEASSVSPRWIPSVAALLLANITPLLGVAFFGWAVFPILFLFWLENVIIGVLNVAKMLCAQPGQVGQWLAKLFLIPFFTVHYGAFTAVHGAFVVLLFGDQTPPEPPFSVLGFITEVVVRYHMTFAVVALATSHLLSFVWNYLVGREYRRTDVSTLMAQPYGRVVVLHCAILLGGFVMMALRSPAVGLVLLVILKAGMDMSAHLRERRKLAGGAG